MMNSDVTIIGLCGKKFSGKTTCTDYLVENYGFKELAFADPMKQAMLLIFRLHPDQLYHPDHKEVQDDYWKATPREMMQVMGDILSEDLPRRLPQLGDSVLIRGLERQLEQESKSHKRFVISDCRRHSEWMFLLKIGARTVRIHRPRLKKDSDAHCTENELENLAIYTPDYLLMNDASVEDLYKKLDQLCESLLLCETNN